VITSGQKAITCRSEAIAFGPEVMTSSQKAMTFRAEVIAFEPGVIAFRAGDIKKPPEMLDFMENQQSARHEPHPSRSAWMAEPTRLFVPIFGS